MHPKTDDILESSLYVSDVARSTRFCQETFGFPVIWEFGERGGAMHAGTRQVLLLFNESGGQFVEEASGHNFFHKLALGWRSALHGYGERKTVSSGDSDDLCTLAPARGTDPSPLFSRSQRSRPQRPLLTSTCLAPADAVPAVAVPLPTCPTAPTAGICGGKSGRADISPATRATKKGASRAIQSPHDGDGELHIAFAIPSAELGNWEVGAGHGSAVPVAVRLCPRVALVRKQSSSAV